MRRVAAGLFLASLVRRRQLEKDLDIPVVIAFGAVEVEDPDGHVIVVFAHLGVDGFRYDPVHARKRTDVDDPVGPRFVHVDGAADVEHHLTERAPVRQVGLRRNHHFRDAIRLVVPNESMVERLEKFVFVVSLELVLDMIRR